MRGNYESLATVSRLFYDPLVMSVARQSQSSEIEALAVLSVGFLKVKPKVNNTSGETRPCFIANI